MPESKKFVRIYSTHDLPKVMLIKSLLNTTEIIYYVTNDSPTLKVTNAINRLSDIMVTENQVNNARELLKDLINQ